MKNEQTLLLKTIAEGEWFFPGRLSSHLAGIPGYRCTGTPYGWRDVIDRADETGLIRIGKADERITVVSSEDVEARREAIRFADSHTPMALETSGSDNPPKAENPQLVKKQRTAEQDDKIYVSPGDGSAIGGLLAHVMPEAVPQPEPKKRRRTAEEVAADKAAKEADRAMTKLHAEALKLDKTRTTVIEREAAKAAKVLEHEEAKAERVRIKAQAVADAKAAKLTEAEGGRIVLPAVVLRNGHVAHVTEKDAWAVIEMYLGALCLDCETSGYPLGHELYELKTVQLGGEEAAIVFDASDPRQMEIAALALSLAVKLHAYSAIADVIPCVAAGLISWTEIWAKMYDAVFNAKLTDPKMSGSDADALKELSVQVLGDYAISRNAEIEKNALFKAMGCLTDTKLTTEPERNGWLRVNRNSVVMTRYAGSDVLDLAAVIRVLPPIPVSQGVVEREREFQDSCARVNLDGFPLDHEHIKMKISEEEAAKTQAQHDVLVLSNGLITNPKSPDVIKFLPQVIPGLVMPINRKSKNESADKESLEKLCRDYPADTAPEAHYLFKRILAYRHHDTTLGLLLRPLNELCEHGDGRMRPTVYTIEASTGRTSCRRPNGQQFSRQGGVRACVVADPGYLGISADFAGCEIIVAAALSGDRGLYEAENSEFCYLCREDPCACGKKHTGLHWRTAHGATANATKEHRYQAKRGTFTRLFGGGAETAAAQVGCPVRDMEAIFTSFNDNAPDFTSWDLWMRDCYKQGSLVWRDYTTGENYSQPIEGANRMVYQTYTGRNVYISNGQHAAGNGAIQGTARELLVDGVLKWKRTRWGGYALLPVHDECICFVPEGEATLAVAELQRSMETTALSSPGFEVKIGADADAPWPFWGDSS